MNWSDEVSLIARAVPSFEGYEEKDSRGRSNKGFFEFLSKQLVRQIDRVAALQIELDGMGDWKGCAELDRGVLRMQALLEAVGTQRREKSRWLELPRVELDDAETLYRIDGRLIDTIHAAVETVNTLERAFALKQPLARPVGELVAAVDAVAEGLANRREIIENLLETNVG